MPEPEALKNQNFKSLTVTLALAFLILSAIVLFVFHGPGHVFSIFRTSGR